MPNFTTADAAAREMCDVCVGRYHQHLKDAGVTIAVLFALPPVDPATGEIKTDKKTGQPLPALKHRGRACRATVQINSYQKRVEGLTDATIIIDEDGWKDMPEPQRMALLDHELTHLELALDKDGQIKLDDCNRPKLKMRIHDYELTGFNEVEKRHKEESWESIDGRLWAKDHQQMLLWG